MYRYRMALLSFAALLVAGVTFGEDFWVKKDYTQWSDEEVKKIMTSSPWAKDVLVSAPAGALGGGGRRGGGATPSGIDVENAGGGARGGRGGRGGGRGGDAEGDSAPSEVQFSLNVSWRSALPLRKAVVKSRAGASAAVPPELQQMLAQEQQEYVIVVSGVPARMARAIQESERTKESNLKIGKKAPLAPKNIELQTRQQTVDVFLAFPKNEPITLDDKEVELDLKLGVMQAKKKFSLKDMVYNGKLEL